MDFVAQLRHALEGALGALYWLPTAEGAAYRIRVPHSQPSSLSAWYLLSVDGREGCFDSLCVDGIFTAVTEQALAGA